MAWDMPRSSAKATIRDIGKVFKGPIWKPADYRDLRTTGDTLAPGQTVTVLLDVVEPAPDTVAFSFDFR